MLVRFASPDGLKLQVFVGARLHVTGGVLRGGRAIEGEGAIAGEFIILFLLDISIYLIYLSLGLTKPHLLKSSTLLLEFGWIEMAL